MATNTYVALDKITVSGSSTNTVTFSAIPQTYKDLVIVCAGTQAALTDMAIRFNGDTAGNYSKTLFFGNGSSTITAPYTNVSQIFVAYQSTSEANVIIHIMNYADTSVQKTVLAKGSAVGTSVQLNSGAWRKSPLEAINSVTIFPFGGTNFSDGYTVSLYGIAAETTSPAPKATGGAIYSDADYYYHVFGSTGVFTPSTSLTADILVVAGGGAGGSEIGGGGGAGGLLAFTSQSLSATTYTCTVGGGAGRSSGTTSGGNGTNSTFQGLTAVVGGGGGGWYGANGVAGGSGGGGGRVGSGAASNASGQGFAGGNGQRPSGTGGFGGGGGGAGAVGQAGQWNGSLGSGGVGGIGATSSFINAIGVATGTGQTTSSVTYFAGGGGGGAEDTGTGAAAGGLGGGGNGAYNLTTGAHGVNATIHTGGGGGAGGGSSGATGGAGGSGIIVVRYLKV